MALVSAFVNNSRSRVTAYLKSMEDMVALQTEFTNLGGTNFTNTFDFGGEIPAGSTTPSTYDMTQQEYNEMLQAIGDLIQAFQGGSLATSTTRTSRLYKGKL